MLISDFYRHLMSESTRRRSPGAESSGHSIRENGLRIRYRFWGAIIRFESNIPSKHHQSRVEADMVFTNHRVIIQAMLNLCLLKSFPQ